MRKFNFLKRINGILVLFAIIFFVILINLFRIQVIQKKKWEKKAIKQYFRINEIIAKRGEIKTMNNEEIAYDLESYELVLDPTIMKKKYLDHNILIFSKYFKIDRLKLKTKILEKIKSKRRYYSVGKNLLNDDKEKMQKELKTSAGIIFKRQTSRKYPKWELFSHITGFINSDRKGKYGIEKKFDKYLSEEKGYQKKYVSTNIVFDLPVGKKGEIVEPRPGKSIILTIDYVIQHILYEELKKGFEENKAKWAAGVVIDPSNGKILAMVSLPNTKKKSLVRNNVIYNQYEPGSVLKPVIMAAALDEGLIKENEIFYSEGKIKIYRAVISDHDQDSKGYLTPTDIIVKSSNVGMVKIGQKFTKKQLYTKLKHFGFGEYTGIELLEERKIPLRNYKKWSGLTLPTISFGQGIAATPLQVAMAFATVINGGQHNKAMIIERIEDNEGKILKTYEKEKIRDVISKDVSDKMRKILYKAVEEGTGRNAKIDGYLIGGKTGTSQKSEGKKGYSKEKYSASFAGFFPVDDPKYLCLIVIDEPKGRSIYGGSVAAPVFREVMKRIINYKKIAPSNLDRKIIKLDAKKKKEKKIEKKKEYTVLPYLIGKQKREVLKILDGLSFELEFKGRGKVVKQYPRAGTRLKKVKKLILKCED